MELSGHNGKEKDKREENPHALWDTVSWVNSYVMEVSEGDVREK